MPNVRAALDEAPTPEPLLPQVYKEFRHLPTPPRRTLKSAIREKEIFLPTLLWIISWALLSVVLLNVHTMV